MKKHKVRQVVMEFMAETEAQKRAARKPRKPRVTPKPVQVAAAADRAERKPLKVTPELAALAKRKADSYTRVNPFRLPDFPIQLMDHIPADRRMAMDEGLNGVSAWAGGAWGNYGYAAAFEGVTFLGYPYLAELAQRPEYRVIVETIATEMTRKWIKLQAKGDKDKTGEIDQLGDELERLKVRDVFCKACEVDGYFGRAHLYIDTGDTDNPKELLTPIGNGENKISQRKLGVGDIKRLAVIEPTWTYPASYNSNNPLKPDWYNPQRWFVMANEVHVSRLLRFVGREVPDMLKPAYSFGGLSLTQMAKPYVDNWLNIRQSVADIIQAFSVFVLGTNLAETLTPGGEQLFARADLFNNIRDNRGLMIRDKETESFENVSVPLGTLDALQAQAQEHMASVSRIPLVKLLGISPHGLNATAEPELRAFYDSILAKQEQFFSPNLRRIIAFAQINLWGKVDPDITFAYEPLWSLDEKAAAEVRKTDAETAAIHINNAAISPEEERARIANDPDSLYPGLDPDDLPDLKEEEEEGLEPKGSAEKLAGGENEEESGGEDAALPFASDDFQESDHPRASNGEFGAGGSSSTAKPKSKKLTPTEKAYLDSYSGDDFLRLNQKLRDGESGGPATAKIDSAIAKSTVTPGTKLYRGISKDALKKLVGGNEINAGQMLSDAGFLSTSTSRNIAGMNSIGGVVMEIEVGEGQHGLDMSEISRNKHEKEVILPRNSKMKVLGLRAPKNPGDPIIVRVSTEPSE